MATDGDNSDWSQGYGFQFWRSRHGYRGDGAYGQYMVILPEADAVVAITSQSADMQGVLDQLWRHLLPALTAESGPPGPWPASAPSLAGPIGDGSTGEITTVTCLPGPGNEVPTLRTVHLTPGMLAIGDVTAALGDPTGWTVTGPVATAYAWSAGALLIDVIFTESPHRLHLTVGPAAGTFDARWQTTPLGRMRLSGLRMPVA